MQELKIVIKVFHTVFRAIYQDHFLNSKILVFLSTLLCIGFETEAINFEKPSKRNAGSNFLAYSPKKLKFDIASISYQDDSVGDPDYTFHESIDLNASKHEFAFVWLRY